MIIKTDFIINYDEIISLIKEKHKFLKNCEDIEISIEEEGDYDKGNHKIKLIDITFKTEKNV